MIVQDIYSREFRNKNKDKEIAAEIGLPLLNYQSRRDTLCEFLADHEFTPQGYLDWLRKKGSGANENVSQRQTKVKPGLVTQAKSFAAAAVRHAQSGFKEVDAATLKKRVATCDSCDAMIQSGRDAGRCAECGCFMKVKAKWSTAKCILGKW